MQRTIDEIFDLCDSRYSLVTAVSAKARELASKAEARGETMKNKPVIEVLNNLRSGRYTIAKEGDRAPIYRDKNFEITISSDEDDYIL